MKSFGVRVWVIRKVLGEFAGVRAKKFRGSRKVCGLRKFEGVGLAGAWRVRGCELGGCVEGVRGCGL